MDKNERQKSIFIKQCPFNNNNFIISTDRISWTTIGVPHFTLNTQTLVFLSDIEININIRFILTKNLVVLGNGFSIVFKNVKNYKGLFDTNCYKINIHELCVYSSQSNLMNINCGWLIYPSISPYIKIYDCILDVPIEGDCTGGFVGKSDYFIKISKCLSYGIIHNKTDGFTGYAPESYPTNIHVINSYSVNEIDKSILQILDINVYEQDVAKSEKGITYFKLKKTHSPIRDDLMIKNNLEEGLKNILFVDKTIMDFDNFFNAINSDTLGIAYSVQSSSYSIIEIIENLVLENEKIERIGFAFDNSNYNSKHFVDDAPFFTDNDLSKTSNYSINVALILWICNKLKIKQIDWLMCNSLQYDNWLKYYNFLRNKTNLTIGASNDKTGNVKYGDENNWILESTNEDIKQIYWNEMLENYSSHLSAETITTNGGTVYLRQSGSIQYSLDNNNWTSLATNDWPVTFVNSSSTLTMNIIVNSNLTLSSSQVSTPATNAKFIFGSNNIVFDGNNKTITISGVTNYQGLFQNNNSTSYTGIEVKNLSMNIANGSTLLGSQDNGNGWYFGQNTSQNGGHTTLTNCTNSGPINNSCGGFFGTNSAYNYGTIVISNCSNTGNIGTFGGGFFGSHAGNTHGNITVSNSNNQNTANTNTKGGIFSRYAGINTGTIIINNVFNTSQTGADGGGILGPFAGQNSSSINITDCWNTGLIGNFGGGIVGRGSGTNGGTITVTNCYNTGTLSSQSGGIFGAFVADGGNTYATSCYNTGTSGSTVGGIYGGNSSKNGGSSTATSCYNNGAFTSTQSGGIFCNLSGDNSSTSYAYYCWNQVPVTSQSGGIFAFNTVRAVATGCYNTGDISTGGGGIFGYRCGLRGNCQAIECYNTGTIANKAGGIFGEQTCLNNDGTASATNCYNTGSIDTQGGGICGNNSTQCTIVSCYSSGTIGSQAGGILGGSIRNSNVSNCYSTGTISGGGGIYGQDAQNSSATNCYSTGIISSGGGIYGLLPQNSSTTKCYIANGTWSSTTALSSLTGTPTYNGGQLVNPVGDKWIATSTDNSTPWLFPTLGYSPYTIVKTSTFTETRFLGTSTSPALNPTGHTYSIISINNELPSVFPWITINQSTGSISTVEEDGYTGLFNIKIMQNSDYSITNFNLNLNIRCFLETTKILCLIDNIEQWIPIKNITKGTLIKTFHHGYKKVLQNKCIKMLNTTNKTKYKLYVLKKDVSKNKDLFEDLYVSGLHSVLLADEELSDSTKKVLSKYKNIRYVDGKKAVMAWQNCDFEEVNDTNLYNLYQLILESNDIRQQYGIFANGILTESVSILTGLHS